MTTLPITNPFLINRCDPDFFCDRELELRALNDAVHNKRPVLLTGRRGIGKTCLVQRLFQKPAIAEAFLCVLADLQPLPTDASLESAVLQLAKAMLRQLPQPLAARFIADVPTIRLTVRSDSVLAFPTRLADAEAALSEIVAFLTAQDRLVLLALDSAEALNHCQGASTFLKALAAAPHVTLILAGDTIAPMENLEPQLSVRTVRLSLEPLNLEIYRRFAQRLFSEGGRQLSPAAFDELYQRFDGNTYAIHFTLDKLYDATPVGETAESAFVPKVMLPVLAVHEAHFLTTFNRLPNEQRALVSAIATRRTVACPTRPDIQPPYAPTSPSTVQSELKALLAKGIIEETDAGWRLTDRLFEVWLRHRLNLPF